VTIPLDLPVGPAVEARPAMRPYTISLCGRFGSVERLVASRHGDALWAELKGHDWLWTYMADGPLAEKPAFAAWLAEREKLADPFCYAVVDKTGRALGLATLMSTRPDMRVIEVGHILLGPSLQRSPLATEAQLLLARYCFEMLGYRRYEWKCDALNAASRRAAARLRVRGHLPQPHDRQGPQPRHRLVRHDRRRLAGAQGRVRALARAGQFRRRGTPAGAAERAE
jgi:RimJ/RimL family protein N-acetyltransferase